ncbi:MAG: DUF3541 domain-containing protein [Candidatus Omnitrophica bacterium]|nr:DUF3541 domain-containing protein [Candidatus Omnitrophota bacterium]
MRRVFSFILIGLLLLHGQTAAFEDVRLFSDADIAASIKLYFESRKDELRPEIRGHWMLRLYRISGDIRYRRELQAYGDYLTGKLKNFVSGLEDPGLKARLVSELLGPEQRSEKGKYAKRRKVLSEVTDYLYMHQLLYVTFMVQSVGLQRQEAPAFQQALTALRGFPFESYLRERSLILYYAAETSNDVYYLKILGLADFEVEYFKAFQSVYREVDERLDPVLLENKIYGMTHLMIAASEYYQRKVSQEKFGWVLDYFDKHLEEILPRLKPDVVAEVGLCFLLAGLPDHAVAAQTRRFIAWSWDPASGIIPSVRGGVDLNQSEHRNVLALMLLGGFDRLYPGPNLADSSARGTQF